MASSKAKRNRRSSGKNCSSKWPLVVAAIAILISILWKDSRRADDAAATNLANSDCGIIMSLSAFQDGGWGLFTLKELDANDQVVYGEVVIQLTNLLIEYAQDFNLVLEHYAWNHRNGGGTLEASSVYSLMPGVGSLANGHPVISNVAAQLPEVSHAGVTRNDSPGAGAFTHYHNVKWFAKQPMRPGDEIIVNYGKNWDNKVSYGNPSRPKRTVKQLRDTGICVDNIRPGLSALPHAGRGAFTTRQIKKGSTISPAPLMVIPRREAMTTRRLVVDPTSLKKQKRQQVVQKSLLLNYCFGHPNSTLLFYPYAPITNLINHDSQHANAKLQWSEKRFLLPDQGLHMWSLEKIQSLRNSGLLMEIVATRDIEEGEEVLLDYGPEWEAAWNRHVTNWKPPKNYNYQYPFEVDMGEDILSIEDTLAAANNLQTACYYVPNIDGAASSTGDNGEEKAVEWMPIAASMKHIQPCRVISRDGLNGLFTVKLLDDNILVINMPRSAIMLKDKQHASDMHLETAFRHEIGIPSDLFPRHWMNLAE